MHVLHDNGLPNLAQIDDGEYPRSSHLPFDSHFTHSNPRLPHTLNPTPQLLPAQKYLASKPYSPSQQVSFIRDGISPFGNKDM
jgi:hypothetical protein